MASPTGQTGGLWSASTSKVGVNIIPLGFQNPLTATQFSATVGTSAHLNDIVAKGIEWVRIPVNPTGALAATTTATETLQIHYARDAIARCIAKGLRVMLSVHISVTDSGWTVLDIINDYPSGAKWLRYLYVLRRYAEMTKQFPSDKLIVLLWNEVDSVGAHAGSGLTSAEWNAAMRVATAAFRSRNRRNCIAMSGTQFSSVDGFADIIPYRHEPRMFFCFTPYEPHNVWTHQGIDPAQVGNVGYISRLSRAIIPNEQATVGNNIDTSFSGSTTTSLTFTGASANITWTSHALSVNDPVYFKAAVMPGGFTALIVYYVKTVVNANTITVAATEGGTAITASTGGTTVVGVKGARAAAAKLVDMYMDTPWNAAYVDTRVDLVSTAATSGKINQRKVIATEYGNHGDFTTNGATEVARALWFAEMRKRLATKRYKQAIWHYDDDYFGLVNTGGFTLNERFLAALNLTNSTSYETEASTLFGVDAVARSAHAKGVANATIKMLKDASLWTTLDLLYLRGDTTTQQLSLNWKNPGTNTMVAAAGALTGATAATGNGIVFSLDGVNDILTTAFNTGTGNAVRDSAAGGVIRITDDGLDSNRIDWESSNFDKDFMVDGHFKNAGGGWRGASGSNFSEIAGLYLNTMVKHAGTSRTGSGGYGNYENGALVESVTSASVALHGSAMKIGNSARVGGQISCVWYGSGLTAAQMATMHEILTFYEYAL